MHDILAAWYDSGSRKTSLLVSARQAGKTFTVRQFPASASRTSWRRAPSKTRRPRACCRAAVPGGTLLFLDEIQKAPDLITVVKFLADEGRYPVVVSGPMLGTELKGYRSFPVGYVQIERMFSLDFEEFCWAQDVAPSLLEGIRAASRNRMPLDEPLHERLIALYRYFVAVGGMPEAVQTYLDSSCDMGAVRSTALQIVEKYRFDISKYAQHRASQIRAVYGAAPSQLDKENKRFRMDALRKGAMFDRYEDDFSWLVDAAVVLPTYSVTEPKRPLLRTAQRNRFKLHESDTGLLLSQYPPQATLDVIANAASVNFGSVYENAVAQALVCENPHLYYFHHSRKGEVDFIVERDDGSLLPVEVKSGKDYKLHTALNNLLGTADFGIGEACVLSMANVGRVERQGKPLWYLPLYMAFCIAEKAGGGSLKGMRPAPPDLSSLPL